jgi:hypothetical protein
MRIWWQRPARRRIGARLDDQKYPLIMRIAVTCGFPPNLRYQAFPTTRRIPLEVAQRPNDRVPNLRIRRRDFKRLAGDVVHDAKIAAGSGKIDRSLDFTLGRAGLLAVDYHNRYQKASNPGRCAGATKAGK